MTIRLPADLEQFLNAQVQSGQFASEEAAIAEAVRLLRERDHERATDRERIEALLIQGLDSGPSTPMTAGDWDQIEHEGDNLIASRKSRRAR